MPFSKLMLDDLFGCMAAMPEVPRLDNPDPDARRRAARALAGCADALPALADRLAVEPDTAVREALLAALAEIDQPGAADALIPFLASDDADLRLGAVEALRRLPGHVAPRIDGLLGDADPDVRLMALEIVTALAPPLPAQVLGRVLARETEVNVLAAALEQAGVLGGADLLPAILATRARHAGDPYLLFCCDAVLDVLGGPRP